MKSMLKYILLLFLVVCASVQEARAGLINHTVTITNDTYHSADITLFMFDGKQKNATVPGKSTYTFNTGIKCPHHLNAEISDDYPHKFVQYYCTKSGRTAVTPADCNINCASSSHRLEVFRQASGYVGYHFVKD